MLNDPSPLSEQPKLLFQTTDDPYNIKVCSTSHTLIFTILYYSEEKTKRYESSFTLTQLVSKSNWFKLFNSIDDAAKEIASLFQSKKYKINEKPNNASLSIIFFIETRVISEVELVIPITDVIKAKPIDIICFKLNKMNKMLQAQSEKFAVLEQSSRYQAIINRVQQLKNCKGLLTEGIKALVSKELSFASEIRYNLIYTSNMDGDSSQSFHSRCDGCMPTLLIIQTNTDAIIGVYTSIPWKQNNYYCVYDKSMFLFSGSLNKVYHLPSNYKYVESSSNLYFAYDQFHVIFGFSTNQSTCSFDKKQFGFDKQEFLNCDSSYFTIKQLDVYEVKIEYNMFSIRFLKSLITMNIIIVCSILILLISYIYKKYL